MARRLIGLDIGTNAVAVAEVTPGPVPRLDMFAQVALPREAMREGEIADEAAVTDAIARLCNEVGLKKVAVRVGIATPRVVVRQVEMPKMTREEFASSLEFLAGELIPIPVEEAVLDFAILGDAEPRGEGGEPMMQVLLAAASEAMVRRLVAVVEGGGLQVAAIDLIPLALTRALAHDTATVGAPAGTAGGVALAEQPSGAEAIVSFGGGVTSIAVHEHGVPRFVRVLGTGGRELTDAIARDLDVPAETAEGLKRAIGAMNHDQAVARAMRAIDRPLSSLLDEVRSSIDYYRNQPEAVRLSRVVVTGGSSQLPGMPERLSALIGVPVEPANVHGRMLIGDIGFVPDELPRLEPYLPAPVGLALGGGGAGVGTVIDLRPRARRSRSARRINKKVMAGAIAAVLLFGGATFVERNKVSDAKSAQSAAEAKAAKLKNRVGHLTEVNAPSGASGNVRAQATTALTGDVAWADLIRALGGAMPTGVWLTTFQGSHTQAPTGGGTAAAAASGGSSGSSAAGTSGAQTGGAAGTPPASATTSCKASALGLTGTVTFGGIASDMPTLTGFVDAASKAGANGPVLADVWLLSAQKTKFGNTEFITFAANATLAPGARSDRLATFFKEALCK